MKDTDPMSTTPFVAQPPESPNIQPGPDGWTVTLSQALSPGMFGMLSGLSLVVGIVITLPIVIRSESALAILGGIACVGPTLGIVGSASIVTLLGRITSRTLTITEWSAHLDGRALTPDELMGATYASVNAHYPEVRTRVRTYQSHTETAHRLALAGTREFVDLSTDELDWLVRTLTAIGKRTQPVSESEREETLQALESLHASLTE